MIPAPAVLVPLSIPSPSQGVWHLGPLPIRAYALCIITGVIVAVWLGEKRWVARGGTRGQIGDMALWGVPAGLIGARAYHVATDHQLYFGPGGNPLGALQIWNGGLGIWGGIAGGILGAMVYCRRQDIRIRVAADALAPCLLVAQAIGRFGNYFNQELYGRATTLPWGLEIDPAHWPDGKTFAAGTTFHPTFLYEALWNLVGAALLVWLDRRFKLGFGRVFALYVMIYTAGRGWIEMLRIDDIELDNVLGLRWGVWMSIVLFVGAAVYFVVTGRRHPRPETREPAPYLEGRQPAPDDADGEADPAESDTATGSEGPEPSAPGGTRTDGAAP